VNNNVSFLIIITPNTRSSKGFLSKLQQCCQPGP